MPSAIGQLTMNAANQAVGGIIGLALQKHNDRRQLKQQEKLQALQIRGDKELTDYNTTKQLEMWEKTGYGAQKEQMEKAGLNPALLYGMSGGGGQSSNVQQGNVSGAQAPTGGGEIPTMIGMGMQLQVLNAQKEVLQTQADKNRAEAEKISGVDTQESKTRIDSLIQNTRNAEVERQLKQIQVDLANIDKQIQGKTIKERIEYIAQQAEIQSEQLEQLNRQNIVNKATMNYNIDMVKAEYIGQLFKNALTKAETTLTGAQTSQTQEQTKLTTKSIEEITNNIMIRWDTLADQQKQTFIKQQLMEHQTELTKGQEGVLEIISQAVDGILKGPAGGMRPRK